MLEQSPIGRADHQETVSSAINRWLYERQQLIALYFELTGARTDDEEPRPLEEAIVRTCEILVDYVSAGHFEIYERLIEEGRLNDNDEAINMARRLLPRIDDTTEAALQFNDKYGSNPSCRLLLDDFKNDLSRIGQVMEERFELEDLLIEALHKAYTETPA